MVISSGSFTLKDANPEKKVPPPKKVLFGDHSKAAIG
jgi:hypothetical protein